MQQNFVFSIEFAMKIQNYFCLLLLLSYSAYCQSVIINSNTSDGTVIEVKNPSAQLALNNFQKGVLLPKLNTSQRLSINTPPKGLMVYDTTTNSTWYFDGSAWIEFKITDNNAIWQINGANQYTVKNGNVGINTTAENAKLEIAASYRTHAIFGSDYAGVSFIANNPTIAFNIFNDSTNKYRHLTNGYGFLQEFNTIIGHYSLIPLSFQNKENESIQMVSPYYLTSNGQFGSKSAFTNGPQTKFFNNDFSRFGEDSPKIKYSLIEGITNNYDVNSAHPDEILSSASKYHLSMHPSKIIKTSIIIECGGAFPFVPPNQCGNSFYNGYCYTYHINFGELVINHEGGSTSLNTFAKPVKILITYTE